MKQENNTDQNIKMGIKEESKALEIVRHKVNTKIENKVYRCKHCSLSFKDSYNLKRLLSTTFPQGFKIPKNIRHPTSGSGEKRCLNGTLKVNRHTDKHTDGQINL